MNRHYDFYNTRPQRANNFSNTSFNQYYQSLLPQKKILRSITPVAKKSTFRDNSNINLTPILYRKPGLKCGPNVKQISFNLLQQTQKRTYEFNRFINNKVRISSKVPPLTISSKMNIIDAVQPNNSCQNQGKKDLNFSSNMGKQFTPRLSNIQRKKITGIERSQSLNSNLIHNNASTTPLKMRNAHQAKQNSGKQEISSSEKKMLKNYRKSKRRIDEKHSNEKNNFYEDKKSFKNHFKRNLKEQLKEQQNQDIRRNDEVKNKIDYDDHYNKQTFKEEKVVYNVFQPMKEVIKQKLRKRSQLFDKQQVHRYKKKRHPSKSRRRKRKRTPMQRATNRPLKQFYNKNENGLQHTNSQYLNQEHFEIKARGKKSRKNKIQHFQSQRSYRYEDDQKSCQMQQYRILPVNYENQLIKPQILTQIDLQNSYLSQNQNLNPSMYHSQLTYLPQTPKDPINQLFQEFLVEKLAKKPSTNNINLDSLLKSNRSPRRPRKKRFEKLLKVQISLSERKQVKSIDEEILCITNSIKTKLQKEEIPQELYQSPKIPLMKSLLKPVLLEFPNSIKKSPATKQKQKPWKMDFSFETKTKKLKMNKVSQNQKNLKKPWKTEFSVKEKGLKKEGTLQDMFKRRKKNLAQKFNERKRSKSQIPIKTKEELIQIRKQMLKSKKQKTKEVENEIKSKTDIKPKRKQLQKENITPNKPLSKQKSASRKLLSHLIGAARPKQTMKEMRATTRMRYSRLPEQKDRNFHIQKEKRKNEEREKRKRNLFSLEQRLRKRRQRQRLK